MLLHAAAFAASLSFLVAYLANLLAYVLARSRSLARVVNGV